MNFDSGVEDAEAEPVEVIVDGRQVVHVEQHRRRRAVVPGVHLLPPAEANEPYRSRSPPTINWQGGLGLGRRLGAREPDDDAETVAMEIFFP